MKSINLPKSNTAKDNTRKYHPYTADLLIQTNMDILVIRGILFILFLLGYLNGI
jgi:hypothetical protein